MQVIEHCGLAGSRSSAHRRRPPSKCRSDLSRNAAALPLACIRVLPAVYTPRCNTYCHDTVGKCAFSPLCLLNLRLTPCRLSARIGLAQGFTNSILPWHQGPHACAVRYRTSAITLHCIASFCAEPVNRCGRRRCHPPYRLFVMFLGSHASCVPGFTRSRRRCRLMKYLFLPSLPLRPLLVAHVPLVV